jgi:two-component system, cell cycle sensor histidine kinase and response regulator CckA
MQQGSEHRRGHASHEKNARPARTDQADASSAIRLEEQLRQLQKVDMLGQLAAGIAHDFNNILTAIVGYADLLETSVPPSEQFRTDIGEIRRAAHRAASLTRQILAFARNPGPQEAIVDVNAVVIEMSNMLRRLVGEDVELTVSCDSGAAPARLDIGHLEQIIMNLVVNARDAMPHGGRISIETQTLTADPAYSAAHPGIAPGKYVVLDVVDEGIGMDEKTRAHLFEPFFTTKAADGGTGLGLSIVSGIVRDSGGQIVVQSSPGNGTRFSILLPLAAESTEDRPRPQHERRALTGRQTVLLVEDDVQVRSLAGLWLRRYGYDVHEATDGEDALAALERGGLEPDLLVTDMVMPNMGGGTLATALRQTRPSLKVLYMSGYAPRPEIEPRLTEPNTGFLQKPFSPSQLLGNVRRLLTWAGPERRSTIDWRPLPTIEDGARQEPRASSVTRLH